MSIMGGLDRELTSEQKPSAEDVHEGLCLAGLTTMPATTELGLF